VKEQMKILHSSDPELKEVFGFALAFAGAVMNSTLYPPEHAIARKHLLHFNSQLASFLDTFGSLRLDVDKTSLRYSGEIVYQGVDEESDIAYLLGRDGIKYLEFLPGIELWELQSLLQIINQYRILDEENDGDIATALWEQDYPHIRYKSVDILALDAPAISFSSFRVAPPAAVSDQEEPAIEGEGDFQEEEDGVDFVTEQEAEAAPSIALTITARGNDLWQLSPLERYELEKMVEEAEHLDNTDNVVDILLILLALQNDREDFTATLDFLQDRFLYACTIYRFDAALKVLSNLDRLRQSFARKKPWALPLFDNFRTTISKKESLRSISHLLSESEHHVSPLQLEYLWRLLCQMDPRILRTLGPLLPDLPLPKMRQALGNVIVHHAQHAPAVLAEAVPLFGEELCLRLLPVIRKMSVDDGNLVFRVMLDHGSDAVRARAFGVLDQRGALEPALLGERLHDPVPEIRERSLALLARRRNPAHEKQLLTYLEKDDCTRYGKEHLTRCYQALGRCGSRISVAFLKKILFGGSLGGRFSREGLHHKQGAALALRALHLPEADKILKDGAQDIFPDIRLACKKALETPRKKRKK
jgi:hypothetical protein